MYVKLAGNPLRNKLDSRLRGNDDTHNQRLWSTTEIFYVEEIFFHCDDLYGIGMCFAGAANND
jgi:hypothetical protein